MSEAALAWARSKPAKSLAQRDVLFALAEWAADDGTVEASLRALTPLCSGMTQTQVQKTADGLVAAGWATKTWDPDRYVWRYRLNVVAV